MIYIVGWLFCSFLAYFLIKADFKANLLKFNGKYHVRERNFIIFLSVLCGPVATILGLIWYLNRKINWDWLDEEAKW